MVAFASIVRDRTPDAVDLLVEALDIAERAGNRAAAHNADEIVLLASGIVTHPALPSDVSEIAARTLDLTGEFPAGMGYGVLGLTMMAHRDNRGEDAATLAGYLSAHLDDLQLSPAGRGVHRRRPAGAVRHPGNTTRSSNAVRR